MPLAHQMVSPLAASSEAAHGTHDFPKPFECGIYPRRVSKAAWGFAAAFVFDSLQAKLFPGVAG